jgi:signal transduction histidine kinase
MLTKFAAICGAVLVVVGVTAPLEAAEPKAILLLHSYGHDAPDRMAIDAAFARAVRDAAGPKFALYIETIDPDRFQGEAHAQLVRTYLRERYAGKPVAVVAAVFEQALAFVLDERDPLFPGVPVVAMLSEQPQPLPAHVSVIWSCATFGETAALALTLSPGARQIALVDAATRSPSSDAVYEAARRQVEKAVPTTTVIALRNLPLEELLRRVSSLPANTPTVVVRQLMGPGGGRIDTSDAIREMALAAPGPIYATTDDQIGSGALGGIVVSVENEGVRLANLAVRVAEDGSLRVPPSRSAPITMFDWRQLRRWRVDERRLPSGSLVRFRDPSAWELYESYIVTGTIVLALQSGLIGGLMIQRVRRRRIEVALRASEAALRQSSERNQDLAGRLLTAQEAERTRIALDLHDDVGQQLAGVGIMLSGLKRLLRRPEPPRDAAETVAVLQERTNALAKTLRHLSHELHPGVLTKLGLVVALQQHVAEVEQHYGITVTLDAPANLGVVDPDIALCLYRVTQEALANSAKHARARVARVELRRRDTAIELRIDDDGVGFVASDRSTSGLGLRSITERVRLLQGTVDVDSTPGRGTTLLVRVPIA